MYALLSRVLSFNYQHYRSVYLSVPLQDSWCNIILYGVVHSADNINNPIPIFPIGVTFNGNVSQQYGTSKSSMTNSDSFCTILYVFGSQLGSTQVHTVYALYSTTYRKIKIMMVHPHIRHLIIYNIDLQSHESPTVRQCDILLLHTLLS